MLRPLRALLLGLMHASRAAMCPLSSAELSDFVAPRDDYMTHMAEVAPQPHLVNCTWYSEATCCTAEDTLRISNLEPEIRMSGMTNGCRNMLHLLMCSVCSPHQAALWQMESVLSFSVPVLRVCDSFCERLHRECGSAWLAREDDTQSQYVHVDERIDLRFEDGLELCRAVGLRVVKEHDHDRADADAPLCFSAARRRDGGALHAYAIALGMAAVAAAIASTDSSPKCEAKPTAGDSRSRSVESVSPAARNETAARSRSAAASGSRSFEVSRIRASANWQ